MNNASFIPKILGRALMHPEILKIPSGPFIGVFTAPCVVGVPAYRTVGHTLFLIICQRAMRCKISDAMPSKNVKTPT
jgi:hypothetical protein